MPLTGSARSANYSKSEERHDDPNHKMSRYWLNPWSQPNRWPGRS